MNMVIVLEILGGILLLAAAVRYAVRDTRQRRGAIESIESEGAGEAPGDEREAAQHPGTVAARREGEDASVLSVSSPAPESPADPR